MVDKLSQKEARSLKTANGINLTMLCDFYELTMGNGYFDAGLADRTCYFDVFFRSVPDGGGFAVAAGLEQIVDYILNLRFEPEDIAYLRSRGIFKSTAAGPPRSFRAGEGVCSPLQAPRGGNLQSGRQDAGEALTWKLTLQHKQATSRVAAEVSTPTS